MNIERPDRLPAKRPLRNIDAPLAQSLLKKALEQWGETFDPEVKAFLEGTIEGDDEFVLRKKVGYENYDSIVSRIQAFARSL